MTDDDADYLPNDVQDVPLPPGWMRAPRRVKRINNSRDLTRELNSVYRDMRVGVLPTQDASRMANALDVLRRVLETGALEERLARLEAELLARQEPGA